MRLAPKQFSKVASRLNDVRILYHFLRQNCYGEIMAKGVYS